MRRRGLRKRAASISLQAGSRDEARGTKMLAGTMAQNDRRGFTLYVQNLRQKVGGRKALGATPEAAALPGWQRMRPEERQVTRPPLMSITPHFNNHPPQFASTTNTRHLHHHAQHSQEHHFRTASSHNAVSISRRSPVAAAQNNFNMSHFASQHHHHYHPKYKKPPQKPKHHEDMQKSFAYDSDVDEEDEWGQPASDMSTDNVIEAVLNAKYESDKQRLKNLIKAKTEGCPDKIKLLRWLFVSAQTFGLIDGKCIPAEIAINEFDLSSGMLDKFSSCVGPWKMDNEVQRNRALVHSLESHGLPLSMRPQIVKCAVITEILGRTEPKLAARRNVRVGLHSSEDDDPMIDKYHLEHKQDRRFVICLRQEYAHVRASFATLADSVGLQYDGFPTSPDDFVLAEAFVDAMSSFFDGSPLREYRAWLRCMGERQKREFQTPWERGDELFCEQHRFERNSCCASVTVSRATYIMLYALEHLISC